MFPMRAGNHHQATAMLLNSDIRARGILRLAFWLDILEIKTGLAYITRDAESVHRRFYCGGEIKH